MNKQYEIQISIVILVLINVCFSDDSVKVTLKQGDVLGKIEKTIFKNQDFYSFKGIPYAAAPVGDLRFKPPTPHKGWEDALEAFEDKPTCLQFSARMRLDEPFGISGSEDCLFISIFSRDLKGTVPVIIFDYNDSFNTGFNGTKTYSPENFLEDDVVVVTISHRLGLFGYLTTEDEVIPGNNGLRDFISGLQWVKDNIKQFGGDPDKVTIMGSCGSGSLVNMMLYSEKAKGLFSGAIIQSGNAFETSYFFTGSKSKAFELGEQFEVQTNDSTILLEVLQKADPEDLLHKVVKVLAGDESSKNSQIGAQPFRPMVETNYDDAVLTELPDNGKVVNDVPVLIGFNSREGLDYVSHFIFDPRLMGFNVEEGMLQFPIRTSYRFEKGSKIYKKATKELVDFYIESKNVDYTSLLEYAVYGGDMLQGYSLNHAVKKLSENLNSPVFYYLFDFRGQLNENFQYITRHSKYNLDHWGATVGDELCYLLVCTRIRRDYIKLNKMVSEQNERKVLKKMVRMWTNFAKTGNPTPSKDSILNNFTWKPTSKGAEDLDYLHITKSLKMSVNPLGERGKFWDDFLKKYAELAVDGVVQDVVEDVVEDMVEDVVENVVEDVVQDVEQDVAQDVRQDVEQDVEQDVGINVVQIVEQDMGGQDVMQDESAKDEL